METSGGGGAENETNRSKSNQSKRVRMMLNNEVKGSRGGGSPRGYGTTLVGFAGSWGPADVHQTGSTSRS